MVTAQGGPTHTAEASSGPHSGQPRGNHHRGRRGRRGRGNAPAEGVSVERPRLDSGGGSTEASSSAPAGHPSSERGRGAGKSKGKATGRGRGRSNGGDGRGRGGGRGGGGDRRGGAVSGSQRMFGGHLTSQTQGSNVGVSGEGTGNGAAIPDAHGRLHGDAPDFVPGQSFTQRKPPPKSKAQNYPLAPKSTASDLPTRIHQDIGNRHYECVICSGEVLRASRVWSCSLCWTVLHLPCVQKWHKSQIERQHEPAQENLKAWRCPGCNSPLTDQPGTYHCWCGKDINPQNSASLPPHSCGQTCMKPRKTCPHPCYTECHAGPCPPCDLMGPSQPCFCGKNEVTKRCTDTDYENGWSCQEICGDLLPCGDHSCQQTCHPGLCGSCTARLHTRCYCGKVHKEMPCDQRGDVLDSFNYGQVPSEEALAVGTFEGCFDCGVKCGRKFDCGVHECERPCHPQDETQATCPLSPRLVRNCPCGKTPLDRLLNQPRQSCQEPVPHCLEVCGRLLACGHECVETCHDGPCAPCFQKMDVPCRCGRITSKSLCHGGDVVSPMCMRVCQVQLNCGRHQCGEHCCPGERRAIERQATRKKTRGQGQDSEDIEAEHICVRVCGRDLKCGSHQCQQMCHRGPCPSCLEAVFEEISCACGRTVLQPPQPCGTKAPECRFDCTRPPPCGHPPVKHNCHPDDVSCPKCPFLVEKPCICGKQRLKNQPCWFQEVRCGLPCGAKLKCGFHTCRDPCHRPGQCEDAGIPGTHCDQACGKPRKSCGHADQDSCHAPYPCKEDKPCQSKTFVTCSCQHRKKEIKCLATQTNPEPERESLKCDDECLRLQRNQRLASALSIDPATHQDDHVPYSDATLRLFRDNMRWAQVQERELRVFASDGEEKRIRFDPMPPGKRIFIHHLADDFGLDTESQDPEPHRHVCVFKTPRFVSAPSKTLAQCLRIRNAQAATAARVGASSYDAISRQDEDGPALRPHLNALLLTAPRFALTADELDAALARDLAAHNTLTFSTSFLPSEEVLIRATPVTSWGTSSAAVEASLAALKPVVARTVSREGLAGAVVLVHADADLNVLRRESTTGGDTRNGGETGGGPGAGGWNAVVGRAAKTSRPREAWSSSGMSAAGQEKRPGSGFVSFSKVPRRKVVQETEEDWEAAADDMDEQGN